MQWSPRNGQWVEIKIGGLVDGAYVHPDGWHVGIFRYAEARARVEVSADGTSRDIQEAYLPHRIVLVDEKGEGVNRIVKDQDGTPAIIDWYFQPHEIIEIRPLLDRNRMPPGRVVAADWQPRV